MRKVILASHGSLAEGMFSAAQMIIGDCSDIDVYGLDCYGQPQVIYQHIKKQVDTHENWEFVILCDINGGSVHNQLMQLMDHENVYLVTGMTLSMVLELKLSSEDAKVRPPLNKVVNSAKENTLIFDHDSVVSEIAKGLEDDCLW